MAVSYYFVRHVFCGQRLLLFVNFRLNFHFIFALFLSKLFQCLKLLRWKQLHEFFLFLKYLSLRHCLNLLHVFIAYLFFDYCALDWLLFFNRFTKFDFVNIRKTIFIFDFLFLKHSLSKKWFLLLWLYLTILIWRILVTTKNYVFFWRLTFLLLFIHFNNLDTRLLLHKHKILRNLLPHIAIQVKLLVFLSKLLPQVFQWMRIHF